MSTPEQIPPPPPPRSPFRLSAGIAIAALVACAGGASMVLRSEAKTNQVAMSSSAKPVSFVRTRSAAYRDTRTYVGTLRPWVEADVGPQLISAYVDTVLVRPGAHVKRGEVLATLDCRNATTASSAIEMRARAIEAQQKALADEAGRTQRLLSGGYASANEAEQALAQSAAESARLESEKANLAHSTLEVGDCVLRAPFEGEIGDRYADPGAFVRPGTEIVSVIDRSTVRFAADVPEVDFAVVAPKTPVAIHVDASDSSLTGTISRRSPHADAQVRTIHFEVDLANPGRDLPVDTTGEGRIEVGEPAPATELPLYAATIRGSKATVFVIESGHVRSQTVRVLGESATSLFVDRVLAPGAEVVTEGRALLIDGDSVAAKEEAVALAQATPATAGIPQ